MTFALGPASCMCKLGWSQDHPDMQKICMYMCVCVCVCVHLQKKYYTKLSYSNHPSINVDYPNLIITRIWVLKIRVMLHLQHFYNNFTTNPT